MQDQQLNFQHSDQQNFQHSVETTAQPTNEYTFLQCFSSGSSASSFSLSVPKTYNNSLIGISRPIPTTSSFRGESSSLGECSSSSAKSSSEKSPKRGELGKHSEDYKQKREKNNIAVRKSREKAKRRLKLNEIRINELISENEQLKNRVDVMSRVVAGLRTLLTTFGYSDHKIDYEISKTLSDERRVDWKKSFLVYLVFNSLVNNFLIFVNLMWFSKINLSFNWSQQIVWRRIKLFSIYSYMLYTKVL